MKEKTGESAKKTGEGGGRTGESVAKKMVGNRKKKPTEKKTKGNSKSWNLILLGVLAVVIAGVTTGVSLMIYHNSGDIYLDRSRPGYLPDEEEVVDVEEKIEDYKFEKTGEMTMEVLEEYENEINGLVEDMGTEEKPFDGKILSDKALGL